MMPFLALLHDTEERSLASSSAAVADRVREGAAPTATDADVSDGDGEEGGDVDPVTTDDEDAYTDDVLPGLFSPTLQLCTYVMPPTAFCNAAVLAKCSCADSFAVARTAVPTGHDGGHAHDTTLFTAHHAEGGAYIMSWVPCTRIAWLAPHPPAKQTSS
jgi:hypothetical protein